MPAAGPGNTFARQQRARKPQARPVTLVRPAPKDTKGAADLHRGAAFQRSRTYYRDFRAAERKNPLVQRASRTLARKPSPQKAKRARADIESVRRRGSDRVAEAAYRHHAAALWRATKGDYPGSDKRPGFGVGNIPAGAAVLRGANRVTYGRGTVRDYMAPEGSARREYSRSVPLHEFAHTRQGDVPAALKEGAAELMRRRESEKMGIEFVVPNDDYARWTAEYIEALSRAASHGRDLERWVYTQSAPGVVPPIPRLRRR